MADTKISDLTAVVTPALTDTFAVVQGGVTKKETGTQLRTVIVPIVLTADVSGTLPVANGGTGITSLGSGVATWLGTPTGANLASALSTALPDSKGGTGITALGSGVATWLGTPSGANLASALTTALPNTRGGTGQDSSAWTGLAQVSSGTWSALTLGSNVATWLGTPSGANLASALTTALPDTKGGTGLTSLGSGVATWLGTPSGANLASALTTALPDTKGGTGITSLGSGVATWLGTPSGANLASALTTALPVSKGGTGVTDLTTFTTAIKTTAKVTCGNLGFVGSIQNNTTGTQHNIARGPIIRLTDNTTITGIDATGAIDGELVLLIIPALSSGITFSHETGSSAANQISLWTGTTINAYEKTFMALFYDLTATKWKFLKEGF